MIYRYEYPEIFEDLERTDFSLYSGNLVLWGAGKIGSITAHVLKQKGIKVLAFVDMLSSKQGTKFCGLDIISPETFFKDYASSELIITTVGRENVISMLEEYSFANWHDAWPLLMEFDFADYSEQNQMYMVRMINYYFRRLVWELGLKRQYLLDRMRFVVTNRCTLRCKECNMFAPCIKKPYDDNWEDIVSDIKTALDALKELKEIELFGGEPFLYSDLSKIITAIKNESRIKQISVITNGTLLPNNELIQALKSDERSIVRISCYGSLSTKIKETEHLLTENNIRYEVMDYKTWYRRSEIKFNNETDSELKGKFHQCMQGGDCILSWKGKLFLCSSIPFLIDENVFPESSSNYYDMRNSGKERSQLHWEIYEYIKRSTTDAYIDACRYCSGKTSTNFMCPVPVAEQIKGIAELPIIENQNFKSPQ